MCLCALVVLEIKRRAASFKGSLEPVQAQALEVVTESEVRTAAEQRLRQSRTKKTAKNLYNRTVFDEDEVVECSIWRELELMAKGLAG